jgi:dTDP-4-amino-4,6-dideoxy-D-galactose acyltransferase
MSSTKQLIDKRADLLPFYSPYHFLRNLPDKNSLKQKELEQVANFGTRPEEHCWRSEFGCCFLYKSLAWDTTFFARPMARLKAVLFDSGMQLINGAQQFTTHLQASGIQHCTVEVPAEDTQVLQALSQAGWLLVETRLQYAHDRLAHLMPTRYAVREASTEDETVIRHIAQQNGNPFDRFHADPFFSPTQADDFLGAYATAAVNGYCDEVLVPHEAQLPVDSFLAMQYQQPNDHELGWKIGRLVLLAVGAQNRGWGRKLFSEGLHRAQERGVNAVLLTTQATNRAVMRNADILGFQLGAVTHMLTWHTSKPGERS